MTTTTTPEPLTPRPPSKLPRRLTTAAILIFLLFVAFAIFSPTLCGSRETANRVKCASNLKQIGQALVVYANAHAGHFPDTLEQFALSSPDLGKDVYICPSSNDEAATGNTPADIAASFAQPHHLSYTYLARGLTTSAPDSTPLIAEPLDNHDHDGSSVLFADGHVDFLPKNEALKLLANTTSTTAPASR